MLVPDTWHLNCISLCWVETSIGCSNVSQLFHVRAIHPLTLRNNSILKMMCLCSLLHNYHWPKNMPKKIFHSTYCMRITKRQWLFCIQHFAFSTFEEASFMKNCGEKLAVSLTLRVDMQSALFLRHWCVAGVCVAMICLQVWRGKRWASAAKRACDGSSCAVQIAFRKNRVNEM